MHLAQTQTKHETDPQISAEMERKTISKPKTESNGCSHSTSSSTTFLLIAIIVILHEMSVCTSLLMPTPLHVRNNHIGFRGSSSSSRNVMLDRLSSTSLFMGGFNKRNKQADLMAKMKAAKAQREQSSSTADDVSVTKKSREAIKEENDRKRFEDLLNRSSSSAASTSYLTVKQEEENADAGFKGVDRLFEGDDAPVEVFYDLVASNLRSLGEVGAKRVVPWLGSGSSREYLIVS